MAARPSSSASTPSSIFALPISCNGY
jgi:hypothetical protein